MQPPLSQVFLRGMWLAPGRSKRYTPKSTGKVGPQGHIAIVIITIALAILGPLLARIFYFAISRKREYLADACAVRFTRYPEGLANALEKISSNTTPLSSANKVTAPMFIVNPLKTGEGMAASGLGGTHPPIHERIAILRGMTRGAGLLQYQRAFSKAKGKPTMIIPSSGLKGDKPTAIREPHPDVVKQKSTKGEIRDVMDLMRAVNGYAFLVCVCGLKIKLPPEFARPSIDCPKCGRANKIPGAELATVGAVVGGEEAIPGTGSGWGTAPAPSIPTIAARSRCCW